MNDLPKVDDIVNGVFSSNISISIEKSGSYENYLARFNGGGSVL